MAMTLDEIRRQLHNCAVDLETIIDAERFRNTENRKWVLIREGELTTRRIRIFLEATKP